jgi:hypothetical protein
MSGKYGNIINQARNTDLQITANPEIQKAVIEEPTVEPAQIQEDDPYVNLTIRVRKSQRAHWSAEAKRKSLTITDAITDALNQRFGEPT